MRLKALKISVMRTTALAALLAATAAAGAANATIVFNLASPTGPLMPTETYTNAATGLYIVATGYNAQGHLTDLSAKNDRATSTAWAWPTTRRMRARSTTVQASSSSISRTWSAR